MTVNLPTLQKLFKKRGAYIYALGFFDGVHLGHRALLDACRGLAVSKGYKTGVVTFDSIPFKHSGLITSVENRLELLRRYGVENCVLLPFDEKLRQMPWQDFLAYLVEEHRAAGFVCGDDFRFGFGGEGGPRELMDFCARNDLPFQVVSQQTCDGVRISSSCIRQRLKDGDVEGAGRFLGRCYSLTGRVVPGKQLGRTIGVPTANLEIPPMVMLPRTGVYACRVGHQIAVTNIGTRPTVEGGGITVEVWILDFEGNLYGSELTVELCKFLRPEKKFGSLEELREEILKNAAQTRKFFEYS